MVCYFFFFLPESYADWCTSEPLGWKIISWKRSSAWSQILYSDWKKKLKIEKAARERRREKFILKDLHGHFILHLDKWLLIVPVYRIYLKTCVNGCCRRRIFTVNGCCRVSWRRWGVCVAKQVRGQDKLWLMTILSVNITKVLCFVFVAF